MTRKETILKANEHIKEASKLFVQLFEDFKEAKIDLDPAFGENSNMAFIALLNCVKHIALINGDITGSELMPKEQTEALNS
jgi:hypothetical protein